MRKTAPARHMVGGVAMVIGGLATLLTGCSPALDWRQLSPTEAPGLTVSFPCKPDVLTRAQPLATLGPAPVPLTQWQCEADGIRWTLIRTHADTPEQRLKLLQALREGLARNMSPPEGQAATLARVGALKQPATRTPHPDEGVYLLTGALPAIDAPPRPMQVVLWQFSKGMDLYQLGAWHPTLRPDDPRLTAFSEGVNLRD